MNNTTEIHKTKVELGYGRLRTVMEWCRENCAYDWHISDVSFDLRRNVSTYEFSFSGEQDAMMFELRWR